MNPSHLIIIFYLFHPFSNLLILFLINRIFSLFDMMAIYLIFAVITAIIFVLGVSLNGLVCLVFYKNRELLNAPNVFITSVAVSDFLYCIFSLPLLVISNVRERWIYGDVGCKATAFIATWSGLTSLMNLSIASYERYLTLAVLYKKNQTFTRRTAVCYSVAMWMYALFWSLMPLCGWSGFELEGIGTSCSVRWKSKNEVDLSYNICLLMACYVLPVSIIITSYYKCCREIIKSTLRAKKTWGRQSPFTKRAFQMERKMMALFVLMTVAFFVAWTPYAVVSMISMIRGPDEISDVMSSIPAYFAKSSCCYNPIVYVFLYKKIRQQMKFAVQSEMCSSSSSRKRSYDYTMACHSDKKNTIVTTLTRTGAAHM